VTTREPHTQTPTVNLQIEVVRRPLPGFRSRSVCYGGVGWRLGGEGSVVPSSFLIRSRSRPAKTSTAKNAKAAKYGHGKATDCASLSRYPASVVRRTWRTWRPWR
jgi:hypothetical protein